MNGRTPAPTDESGALDFQDKPARPSTHATLHLSYKDVPVDLQVGDKNTRQIEEMINALLTRGWKAPPRSSGGGGFGPRKDDRIDPAYDDQGNEVCPVHRAKLREYKTQDGRTFKGCPSKADESKGEKVNQRGYCSLRFKE